MSTRSQILWTRDINEQGVRNKRIGLNVKTLCKQTYCNIYKHSDGYPTVVGKLIKEFFETEGAKNRIFSVRYLSAWFLSYIMDTNRKDIKELNDFLGYGIDNSVHCDIEWLYIINEKNMTFYVFKIDGNKYIEIYNMEISKMQNANDMIFDGIMHNLELFY
jgi:hypothetical protein